MKGQRSLEAGALIIVSAWERMRLACEAASHASRVRSQAETMIKAEAGCAHNNRTLKITNATAGASGSGQYVFRHTRTLEAMRTRVWINT